MELYYQCHYIKLPGSSRNIKGLPKEGIKLRQNKGYQNYLCILERLFSDEELELECSRRVLTHINLSVIIMICGNTFS